MSFIYVNATHTDDGLLSAADKTKLDGLGVPASLNDIPAPLSSYGFGGQRLTTLADPTSAQDAATKAYTDAQVSGARDIKDSVRLLSTSNITTSNPATSTFDGVVAVSGNRIALTGQNTASQNGLYLFNGISSAMTRTTDADTSAEVTGGLYFWVNEGASYADTGWLLTTNDPITLGFTSLAFTQVSALGQIGVSDPITKSGPTLGFSASYAGQTSITTLGAIITGTWEAGDVTAPTVTSAGEIAAGGTIAVTGDPDNFFIAHSVSLGADLWVITSAGCAIHTLGATDEVFKIFNTDAGTYSLTMFGNGDLTTSGTVTAAVVTAPLLTMTDGDAIVQLYRDGSGDGIFYAETDHGGIAGGPYYFFSGVRGAGGSGRAFVTGSNGFDVTQWGGTSPIAHFDNNLAVTFAGTVTAPTFSGSVAAANLTGSHTLPDGTLSTNVPLLNASQSFTGGNVTFTGAVTHSGATTFSAAVTNSVNGAASTPALKFTGTVYNGGNATTNKPLLLVEPSGTTSTGWGTTGTALGVNLPSGTAWTFIDCQIAGTSAFKVTTDSTNGRITCAGNPSHDMGGGEVDCATFSSRGANNSVTFMAKNFTTAGTMASMTTGTFSNTSGAGIAVTISPTYNQASGSGANTDLQIKRVETALQSGAQSMINCLAGSTGATQVFNVDNIGGVIVGGGTRLKKVISATASLNFPSISAASYQDLTISVTGAADGDPVSIGAPNAAATASVIYFAWVSAADTVTVRAINIDPSNAHDPASGTFRAAVTKF